MLSLKFYCGSKYPLSKEKADLHIEDVVKPVNLGNSYFKKRFCHSTDHFDFLFMKLSLYVYDDSTTQNRLYIRYKPCLCHMDTINISYLFLINIVTLIVSCTLCRVTHSGLTSPTQYNIIHWLPQRTFRGGWGYNQLPLSIHSPKPRGNNPGRPQ